MLTLESVAKKDEKLRTDNTTNIPDKRQTALPVKNCIKAAACVINKSVPHDGSHVKNIPVFNCGARGSNASQPVHNDCQVPSTATNINAPHNNCGVFSDPAAALGIINSMHFWDAYEVTNSRADGHCILYSVISSLRSQHGMIVTKTALMQQIVDECIKNKHRYNHVFDTDDSPDMLETEVYAYVFGKTYGTLFVDILPEILAHILDIYVIVFYKHGSQFKYHIVPHTVPAQNDKAVLLIKQGDHYNGLKYVETPL